MMTDQCNICKHNLGLLTCLAFPKRIPDEILTGDHDHTKPFHGDSGIRFEPMEIKETEE